MFPRCVMSGGFWIAVLCSISGRNIVWMKPVFNLHNIVSFKVYFGRHVRDFILPLIKVWNKTLFWNTIHYIWCDLQHFLMIFDTFPVFLALICSRALSSMLFGIVSIPFTLIFPCSPSDIALRFQISVILNVQCCGNHVCFCRQAQLLGVLYHTPLRLFFVSIMLQAMFCIGIRVF